MKACKICAKEIPDDARKCTECGEFQSLHSRIFAGLDLKGLLALLPLLALIYAFLAERIEIPRSELRITPVACVKNAVTVFASNTGNRMALLESAQFAAGPDPTSTFDLPQNLSTRLFEGGTSRLLTLTVDLRRNPAGLASFQSVRGRACTVALTFTILQYDHSKDQETASCVCPSS